jgi:AGZA family xanthine/uracil permease-like MFS transporter
MKELGEGAILAGLVLGAIVAFIIDRRFLQAGIFALFGAALSWIGLIHGEKVEWAANPQVALGYLFMAVTLFAFMALKLEPLDENREVAAE